jgi:ribonuclease Z
VQKNLLSNLAAAYVADIKGREEEQHLPAEGVASKVDEFSKDGVVYEKDGVRVTAFEVDHGFKPAYGYRIDYDGRSVLLSGDTKLNDNVVKHGEGVDLLIHEVFVASAELLKSPAIQPSIPRRARQARFSPVLTPSSPRILTSLRLAPRQRQRQALRR